MPRTEEYAEGRLLDVHEPSGSSRCVVLLWGGSSGDQRTACADLADRVAATGLRAVVPDWDAGERGGMPDLLRSMRWVREHGAEEPLVVAGVAEGGRAAVSLGLHARRLGLVVPQVVAIGADLSGDDPLSGEPLTPGRRGGGTTSFLLVLGAAGSPGTSPTSYAVADAMRAQGWPVETTTLDGDPGGSAAADRVAALVAATVLG